MTSSINSIPQPLTVPALATQTLLNIHSKTTTKLPSSVKLSIFY
ncbi:MAG: hypothetical protein V7782_08875 [Psychromonas sp.]